MSTAQLTLWTTLATFLIPIIASAIPPPKVIEQMNLKADVIAVGEVTRVHAGNSTSHFVLQVGHVIKGIGDIKPGDDLHVEFKGSAAQPGSTGIAAHSQGVIPVKVETGSIVVVYVKPSPDQDEHFSPVLEGLSVITVGSPQSKEH
jgi:hypothetical protein